jgi:hypothetical protein
VNISIASLLVALADPTEERVAELAPHLHERATAAGPFIVGSNKAEVLEAMIDPAVPLLASATFELPEGDENQITIFGKLPPGAPVFGVRLSVNFSDGLITELFQEVEMFPSPDASEIVLIGPVGTAIDEAFAKGTPMAVCYVNAAGVTRATFRGAVHVFSSDELAIWVRDSNGGLIRSIALNPSLGLLYRNTATRVVYELSGRARVVEEDSVRNAIFDASPPFERGLDPMRRGAAVLVTIDSVTGGTPGAGINMKRVAGPASS